MSDEHPPHDARLGDAAGAEAAHEMPLGNAQPRIRHARHVTGGERIGDTGRTVADFWEWAMADLVSNTNRSVFAEYLVGLALDSAGSTRVEWDRWDLTYRGHGVEVKAVGRVQAWALPKRASQPRFDIAAKMSWDPDTNVIADVAARSASVWVFAECATTIDDSRHVTDPSQWSFHVTSARWLNEHLPTQRSLALSRLRLLIPTVRFDALRSTVDDVVDGLAE